MQRYETVVRRFESFDDAYMQIASHPGMKRHEGVWWKGLEAKAFECAGGRGEGLHPGRRGRRWGPGSWCYVVRSVLGATARDAELSGAVT